MLLLDGRREEGLAKSLKRNRSDGSRAVACGIFFGGQTLGGGFALGSWQSVDGLYPACIHLVPW